MLSEALVQVALYHIKAIDTFVTSIALCNPVIIEKQRNTAEQKQNEPNFKSPSPFYF